MEFALNRSGGVPVRVQLARQVEMQILGGRLRSGARLPSVRALARRLGIHPNTVSQAYQELQATGHVLLQPGAGVYVRGAGPTDPAQARGVDEMIRLSLDAAGRKGFSGAQVRTAVARWLAAAPAQRIEVVDPCRELAELLVHELRPLVPVAVNASSLAALAAEPAAASDALIVCVPYHVERVRTLVPGALVAPVTLEIASSEHAAIARLPSGSLVLVVSHAAIVLPFAEVLLKSLRGDELHVEVHALAARAAWTRLATAADVVFADGLAATSVRAFGPRRLHEFRMVGATAVARICRRLAAPVPAYAQAPQFPRT